MARGTIGGRKATTTRALKGRKLNSTIGWLFGPFTLLIGIATTYAILQGDIWSLTTPTFEAHLLFSCFDYSACFFASMVVAPQAYTALRADGWNWVGCAAWAVLAGWLCANGGGAIYRNSFEGMLPFPWRHPEYNLIAMAGALLGLLMLKITMVRRQAFASEFLDRVCSGVFVCLGAAAATRMSHNQIEQATALGGFFALLSANFGGLTADLLRRRAPTAFTGLGWLASISGGIFHIHVSHWLASTPPFAAAAEWSWVATVVYVIVASMVLGQIKLKR
jgi:uncharacterized membrane protein YeiH